MLWGSYRGEPRPCQLFYPGYHGEFTGQTYRLRSKSWAPRAPRVSTIRPSNDYEMKVENRTHDDKERRAEERQRLANALRRQGRVVSESAPSVREFDDKFNDSDEEDWDAVVALAESMPAEFGPSAEYESKLEARDYSQENKDRRATERILDAERKVNSSSSTSQWNWSNCKGPSSWASAWTDYSQSDSWEHGRRWTKPESDGRDTNTYTSGEDDVRQRWLQ